MSTKWRARNFDVVVVGAGPAGSATARELARSGASVALIERSHFDKPRVGESLAPNVQPLLRDLGVWDAFLALNPLASLGTRSSWGDAGIQTYSHLISPWGCGWHVDRLAFDRMLADAAQTAGAELMCGTTPIHCAAATDGWLLTVAEQDESQKKKSESTLRAKVIVDATGRSAQISQWLAAKRMLFDHLVGLATQFDRIPTVNEGYVLVESSTDGWWYSAPLPNDRMITMLMTDADLCRRGNLCTAPVWFGRLHSTLPTRDRVGGGSFSWGPRVVSAISQRLRRPDVRAQWIAVGDASLAVDPISGSGVIRALRSARAGAETALAILAGQTHNSIHAYETAVDQQCSEYLHERATYYAMENRWRQSSFWRRRAAAVARVTSSRRFDR